jgi:hypothetical protein
MMRQTQTSPSKSRLRIFRRVSCARALKRAVVFFITPNLIRFSGYVKIEIHSETFPGIGEMFVGADVHPQTPDGHSVIFVSEEKRVFYAE